MTNGLLSSIARMCSETTSGILDDRIKIINSELEEIAKYNSQRKTSSDKKSSAVDDTLRNYSINCDYDIDLTAELYEYLSETLNLDDHRSDEPLSPPRISAKLEIDEQKVVNSIRLHIQEAKSWSEGVKFKELHKSKNLSSIYIELGPRSSSRPYWFKLERKGCFLICGNSGWLFVLK